MDQTLEVLGTEFGRTPRFNGNDGRDHDNEVITCLLAGAGVEGREVWREMDSCLPYFPWTAAAPVGEIERSAGKTFSIASMYARIHFGWIQASTALSRAANVLLVCSLRSPSYG